MWLQLAIAMVARQSQLKQPAKAGVRWWCWVVVVDGSGGCDGYNHWWMFMLMVVVVLVLDVGWWRLW